MNNIVNVLWITNGLFPEALSKLCGQNDLKGSGGWMLGLSEALLNTCKVHLTVAGVTPLVKQVTQIEGKQINYYAIPLFSEDRQYDKAFERVYRDIYGKVEPDVVHIHGTEFPHSLAALRACGAEHTVVSLQGLVSVISSYYLGGLTKRQVLYNPSFHDIMKLSLIQQQRDMVRQGRNEIQLLKEAQYIIGRTSWDKSHVWAINKDVHYFHCNEVLREEFYDGALWSYNNCKQHSIFLSQGRIPFKGLHKMLEAMPLILRSYPDASLRVAGPDITCSDGTIKDVFRLSTYGRIIKKMIKENNLGDKVVFLGSLNAQEMKREYLSANVFVCPSSIENSPNSLGEAQILGTPVVASYVGGIPDMMRGNEENLYRFEETKILARIVCRIFENDSNIDYSKMTKQAINRHNPSVITNDIVRVYNTITSNCCIDYEEE